ncbi:dihydrolipoyl dehydrogenase [Mycoplasma miroungirhinis]|uniref:Dihydrolipoyl dehydrogenase n=1 Tax=Mycoplasma miroungirhinis TaxID=754516 RepID=A0A6M4JGN4_9MOLU|nr:dihydrolipoyl dehydrogenase [Mycoplasma miroungirhinis]QJR44172.1 dihydrolipoyl dehydrogenase [Mycoplasma miroungirhinis]
MNKYDIVIIGAGPGGYTLAAMLAKHSKKVAIVEKKHFGGTCINEGCISTKTLIKSAKVFEELQQANKYGFREQKLSIDFDAIQDRRLKNKQLLNTKIENLLTESGVKIYFDNATVIDEHTIQLQDQKIQFDKLVIATGAKSRELNIKGFKEAAQKGLLINSTQALNLKQLPKTLNIIGSGPISLEFAYFYATLGTKVKIFEARSFMGNYDKDLQDSIREYLQDHNIELYENVELIEFDNDALVVKIDNKKQILYAEKTLLAVGRVANVESVSTLNLELTKSGAIAVNEKMQTSIKHIYALGDVTGLMQLSSVAYKTADIITEQLLGLESETLNTNLVAWSVYINPEFSGVGLNETQLKAKGMEYNVIKFPTSALPRTLADGLNTKNGFVKFLLDKHTNQILGAFMWLEGSHLIINQIAQAMQNKISFDQLEKSVYTHPTIAEVIYYATRNFVFSKK